MWGISSESVLMVHTVSVDKFNDRQTVKLCTEVEGHGN